MLVRERNTKCECKLNQPSSLRCSVMPVKRPSRSMQAQSIRSARRPQTSRMPVKLFTTYLWITISTLWIRKMPKPTRTLTCTFANVLASPATLQAFAGARRMSSKRGALRVWGVLCLATYAILSIETNAHALTPKDSYILYFHSQIQEYRQFTCGVNLYSKESNWSASASNAGHYGIPQLNNKMLKHMDPYSQIDMGIKYVAHRYKHDGYCEAYKHFQRKGWH